MGRFVLKHISKGATPSPCSWGQPLCDCRFNFFGWVNQIVSSKNKRYPNISKPKECEHIFNKSQKNQPRGVEKLAAWGVERPRFVDSAFMPSGSDEADHACVKDHGLQPPTISHEC
jgi:hypothetical protein